MKRTTLFFTIIFSVILTLTPFVSKAEIVKSFVSDISVFPDSSLIVEEEIDYDFENSLKHGIYREIPLVNERGENIEINVLSVTDKEDNPHKFNISTKDKVLNIKIGDPGVIISGEKIYKITYKVFGAIDYYENYDEVHWNITGNSWNVPIESSGVSITLPKGVFPKERKCYYGLVGSETPCRIFDEKTFRVERILNKGEGITIAVSFEKGPVQEYVRKTNNPVIDFLKTFWPTAVPIIAFSLMFIRWFKKGRDPKQKKVIKAEYTAPKEISPLEAGGIVHETIKSKSISAEIIDLAIKGYIKIKPTEERLIGSSYKQDYELTLKQELGFIKNNFDKQIIKTIFGDNPTVGGVTMLSSLDNLFYKSVSKISGLTIDSLLKKKYYFNFPKNLLGETAVIIMSIFFIFFSLGFWIWEVSDFQDIKKLAIFFTSLIASISVTIIFNLLMPSKTEKGVQMKEYLLGLREYLKVAEEDRIKFHNAPEKRPEVFEALLPYAIVFGVEKQWAKEFEEIYKNQPEWF
jgi:hypothetical protein